MYTNRLISWNVYTECHTQLKRQVYSGGEGWGVGVRDEGWGVGGDG